MNDLKERLEKAADTLQRLGDVAFHEFRDEHAARLRGKAEGVRLALSYIEEMERGK